MISNLSKVLDNGVSSSSVRFNVSHIECQYKHVRFLQITVTYKLHNSTQLN